MGCSGTHGTLGGFAFAAVAATSTAAAAAFFLWRVGGFSDRFRGGLLDIGFGFRRSGRSFGRGGILFWRESRLGNGNGRRRQHKIARRMRRIDGGNFLTEPDSRFLRLGFPIRSTKTVRRGEVPFGGFGILAGGFEIAGQFKRNHGIAGFFIQIRKLPDGIFASAGPTNPGGDLFPVSHVLACIVAAEACYSQRRQAARGKRFLLYGMILY